MKRKLIRLVHTLLVVIFILLLIVVGLTIELNNIHSDTPQNQEVEHLKRQLVIANTRLIEADKIINSPCIVRGQDSSIIYW